MGDEEDLVSSIKARLLSPEVGEVAGMESMGGWADGRGVVEQD